MTGAYLGTPLSFVAMGALLRRRGCARHMQQVAATQVARTRERERASPPSASGRHVRGAWAPIAGLIVIAVLQNIDIIAAKHRFTTTSPAPTRATAVAAKVLIWVAMGAGFYLVPEVSRRRAAGEDTRPVLVGALGIVAVCASRAADLRASRPTRCCGCAFGPKTAAGRRLAARARPGVHRARLHLPGDPVHAGAAAQLVPARARRGRGRRAGPAAQRVQQPDRIRHRRARRAGGRSAAGLRLGAAPRPSAPPGALGSGRRIRARAGATRLAES